MEISKVMQEQRSHCINEKATFNRATFTLSKIVSVVKVNDFFFLPLIVDYGLRSCDKPECLTYWIDNRN